MLGSEEGIEAPHLYLMQPYDPDRRIIFMLHGLASSPEAWINVANEVLGDETLRQHYQIWQVYYPTNAPLAVNNRAIRDALGQTMAHFDPAGTAQSSRDAVVIGHSMGGVLSRLLVSSSGAHGAVGRAARPGPAGRRPSPTGACRVRSVPELRRLPRHHAGGVHRGASPGHALRREHFVALAVQLDHAAGPRWSGKFARLSRLAGGRRSAA